MYKFSNCLANSKLVLVRRTFNDGKCSALVVVRPLPLSQREYSNKADPHLSSKEACKITPRPKSSKYFWGAVGAITLTGALTVYAKNSTDTRNWLETNLPIANDFVALVYRENTTYYQFAANQLSKATGTVRDFLFGKEGISPLEFQQRSEQDLDADAAKAFAKKTYQLPPVKIKPLYVEELVRVTPEVETPATLIQTEECIPQLPPAVKVTKDMVQLEHDMHTQTKIAIDKYKEATKECARYNKALFLIVETPYENLCENLFSSLQGTVETRDQALAKANEASKIARCALETLNRNLDAGRYAVPADSAAATQRYIKQFRADLDAAEDEYNKCREKATLADAYWTKVNQARQHYKDELQAMFPGIDLQARILNLKGKDTDLLLLYTLKQIHYYQNALAEIQTVRERKLNRAIECHDEKELIELKVEDMVKKDMIQKEKEYNDKWVKAQAEANQKLKEQLKKQYEINQEVMQDKLARKEKEIMGKYKRCVSEELEKDRVATKKELAAIAGKMQAIEKTLKKRAAAEAEARRSQSVWAAAEALLATTRKQQPAASIDNEVKALEKAGKDDKLVKTVLNGIPKDVREKGIVTETALRDRFETLEKSTAKVALVGRDGAGLPIYFLSWLQSKLLFQRFDEIPKDELDNLPTDFTKLDTFEIMLRAKYHMEHGALGAAVRYVNLLQGAPRATAAGWLRDARHHLEVKQAAEAVMAHASSSGLLYL